MRCKHILKIIVINSSQTVFLAGISLLGFAWILKIGVEKDRLAVLWVDTRVNANLLFLVSTGLVQLPDKYNMRNLFQD